jgi:hypothetical protein
MYNKSYKLVILVILGSLLPLSTIYAEDIFHDPTQPSSYSQTIMTNIPNGDIVISAIIIGKNRKTVIIGNHSFTIGDKISGATIATIDTDSIVIRNDNGSELRVNMPYYFVKQPTTNKKEGELA